MQHWYWLLILFVSYLGIWILPVISGARIGFYSKILMPPSLLPIILVIYNEYAVATDVFLVIVQMILAFIILWLYSFENKLEQETIDEIAQEIFESVTNNIEHIPYSLYLRPFDTTDRLMTQKAQTVIGSGMHIDFETLLHRVLEPYFFMCGLGRKGEMLGAGRIQTNDDIWYKYFQILVENADLVLMIPSDHEGTLTEMQYLTEQKLLYKCIYIMPETIDENLDYESKWKRTQKSALKLGWEIPFYDSSGGVFTLKEDGKLDNFEYLSISVRMLRVQRLRKIFRKFNFI